MVLRPGASLTLGGLLLHLQEQQVAKSKWPERLEVLEAMPESAGGKQSKVALREFVLGARAQP